VRHIGLILMLRYVYSISMLDSSLEEAENERVIRRLALVGSSCVCCDKIKKSVHAILCL
jgi:hypothetical protein